MVDIIRSETPTAPGLYHMSEAAYHADPCVGPSLSRSIAEKLILESPRHAFAAHPRLTKPGDEDEAEEKSSRTRDIGSAAHALLLGQPTEIAVLDYKDFKKKAAQEERAAAQERGAIPLLGKDHKLARAMVEKAKAVLSTNHHPAIRALIGDSAETFAGNEVTAVWLDRCGDVWARARLDRISITGSQITILDYKTTELSVEPSAVARALYNNNYHFQDAFYRRGIRQLFPAIDEHKMRLDFLFIMQEQNPPHEITVARVDNAGRLIGEKMASAAFLLWRKCVADNDWPGYPGGIVEAEMPAFIDTRWTSKEIEDPRLQHLGFDPVLPFESNPYKPKQIMEPN